MEYADALIAALDAELVRKGPGSVLSQVFGALPGDETEGELADALDALDAEGKGE